MTQKQQFENRRELSEKRIVVLGGSSGIGLAVVQQVVARGARAIIASSNAERVKQAVATLDGTPVVSHHDTIKWFEARSARVNGVQGLRVADASIMPCIVSGNINAACAMIGEKLADLVKADLR